LKIAFCLQIDITRFVNISIDYLQIAVLILKCILVYVVKIISLPLSRIIVRVFLDGAKNIIISLGLISLGRNGNGKSSGYIQD